MRPLIFGNSHVDIQEDNSYDIRGAKGVGLSEPTESSFQGPLVELAANTLDFCPKP